MAHRLPHLLKSLRNFQTASEDTLQPLPVLEKVDSLLNLQIHSSTNTAKYQLWLSQQSRNPVGLSSFKLLSSKLTALSMGRAPTSLSDNAVSFGTVPFYRRSGSLARRRKVSVPELRNTMTTVQEAAIDSRMLIRSIHSLHVMA
jgi:hypothetical protein